MPRKHKIQRECSIIKHYKPSKFQKLPFDVRRATYIVNSDDGDVRVGIKRERLLPYVGMIVDFDVLYSHMSTDPNGKHVVCVKNVRDPISHELISDHAWMKITPYMSKFLHTIEKENPIHVKAKVIMYDNGYKVGLKPIAMRKSIWNDRKVL